MIHNFLIIHNCINLLIFLSETDEEGDVEDDHAFDWSSSDEENENINDNA